MGHVIRMVDMIPGATVYLRSFDPEANGGRGDVGVTTEPDEAMVFETTGDALELWRKQSVTVPLRTDGKPNRPMTAFTIEILPRDGIRDDWRH